MLIPIRTTQFKRDVKLAEKRAKKMSLLREIMAKVQTKTRYLERGRNEAEEQPV